ncbi:hypothetical protein AMS68_005850 [Peltaster fructicola]|uniref:SET domain-containing protein n=1 Tax=Peltaster fructicola TaxID=286661 RepID=A0A6H0XZZ3_9PEZI|nr:hypothetical protein AMS68_005850 [Peltaster fructicola]
MPPTSDLFELQDIANAGRGLIAIADISKSTKLLTCADPAVHVVFREYRKEVCAYCFHYDRGRSLPIRNNDIAKVFCSEACHLSWREHTAQIEIEAWQRLESFVKSNSKVARVFTTDMLLGPKPTIEDIASQWAQCDDAIRKGPRVRRKNKALPSMQAVYPDVLSFELSAILLHHKRRDVWDQDMAALVFDETPYKSFTELQVTCNSVLQLATLLPPELIPSCSSSTSLTATAAGSHNAFGIRAGGEDKEEYLAWAIYPDASYFNHSCDPNIDKQRIGRGWHFSAARDISQGEQLCISYLGGDEKDMSVTERRTRLETVWGFICACQHCQAEQTQQQDAILTPA